MISDRTPHTNTEKIVRAKRSSRPLILGAAARQRNRIEVQHQRGAISVIKSFTAFAISGKPATLNSFIDTKTPTPRVGAKAI